jgi:uncharacterized protein YgbK (DUF1537 family)
MLACIADDFTGATDLANTLVRAGLRTRLHLGVPSAIEPAAGPGPAAEVVALKIRTAPVAEAVQQALASAAVLRAAGGTRGYFKVCSTFDSTPAGNIGPVAEALRGVFGAVGAVRARGSVLVTPAFPATGRTVYRGHLFVHDTLLSESPLRAHPLTPMTDSNLVRWLGHQLPAGTRVGLVAQPIVARGAAAVRERLAELGAQGFAYAVADALCDADLHALAAATRDDPLVVAASGLALGWPAAHGVIPDVRPGADAASLPPPRGRAAIVAGSCSAATLAQIEHFRAHGGAAWRLDAPALGEGEAAIEREVHAALAFARGHLDAGPVLVYASAAPEAVAAAKQSLGEARAGALVEAALSRVARALVATHGVGRLVIAGGETSGACVQALGVASLAIGAQIDEGVPWCHTVLPAALGGAGLHLALKSGNFGGNGFFTKAFEELR